VYEKTGNGANKGNGWAIQDNNYGYNGTAVHKDYVLDYTNPLANVIMEAETGGLAYRYDAADRRFLATDKTGGNIAFTQTFNK